MNKRGFVVVVIALFTAVAMPRASAQRDWSTIAPDGTTELRLSIPGNRSVKVAIATVRLSQADKLFPGGESFEHLKEVTAVRNLTISTGSEEVFVWRSVYADLINPTTAAIRSQGRGYVLTIGCMDGAEAFSVEVFFDSSNVTRRVTRNALVPKVIAEDTIYRISTLGRR